jgi:hypothetical protein
MTHLAVVPARAVVLGELQGSLLTARCMGVVSVAGVLRPGFVADSC